MFGMLVPVLAAVAVRAFTLFSSQNAAACQLVRYGQLDEFLTGIELGADLSFCASTIRCEFDVFPLDPAVWLNIREEETCLVPLVVEIDCRDYGSVLTTGRGHEYRDSPVHPYEILREDSCMLPVRVWYFSHPLLV